MIRLPRFEFDPAKSESNREKHEIGFDEARELWLDPVRLEVAARTEAGARFVVIGRIGGRHWSAVITYRGAAVRLISVRGSRASEVRVYEGK
jgi:uncharacterized DUF497 family protein